MSPLELPGKSFGYLPDSRNIKCDNCGRSIRKFLLQKGVKDRLKGKIQLRCPHCDYQLVVVDESLVKVVKDEEKVKGKKNVRKGKKTNKSKK